MKNQIRPPRNIKRGRLGTAKLPLSLICWLNVNDTHSYSPVETSCSASLRPLCAVFDFFSHLLPIFLCSFFSSSLILLCLRPSGFKGPLYSGAAEVKQENVDCWKRCHAVAFKENILIIDPSSIDSSYFFYLCSRSQFCASLLSLALFSLSHWTYFMLRSFSLSSCVLLSSSLTPAFFQWSDFSSLKHRCLYSTHRLGICVDVGHMKHETKIHRKIMMPWLWMKEI